MDNLKISFNEKTGRVVISFDPNVRGELTSTGKSHMVAKTPWIDLKSVDDSLAGIKLNMVAVSATAAKKKVAAKRNVEVDEPASSNVVFKDAKSIMQDALPNAALKELKAVFALLADKDHDWNFNKPNMMKRLVREAYAEMMENNDDGDEDETDNENAETDDESADDNVVTDADLDAEVTPRASKRNSKNAKLVAVVGKKRGRSAKAAASNKDEILVMRPVDRIKAKRAAAKR